MSDAANRNGDGRRRAFTRNASRFGRCRRCTAWARAIVELEMERLRVEKRIEFLLKIRKSAYN